MTNLFDGFDFVSKRLEGDVSESPGIILRCKCLHDVAMQVKETTALPNMTYAGM